MGAWGSFLYANDTTCDVRDTYMKFLQDQCENREAYRLTIENYKECIGNEEEPLLWFALADTQWRMGRLMPEVKENALLWIKKGGGLELWEESKNGGAGWKKTLNKLENKLMDQQPPEKIIKKPVQYTQNPWNVGDLYAYQFNTDIAKENGFYGKYIVFQKIGNGKWFDDMLFSVIQVYDRLFDNMPMCSDIEGVRLLPLVESLVKELKEKKSDEFYNKYFDNCLRALMINLKKSHYPEKYFHYIGNQSISGIEYHHSQCKSISWEKKDLDRAISFFYLQWEGVEY